MNETSDGMCPSQQVETGTTPTGTDSSEVDSKTEAKGDSGEFTPGKPTKKRSTFDLLKDTGNKLRSASAYRIKNGADKDPVKELRRRATLKRSNSLDSASFRAVSSEVRHL